jgi:putative colanic acid biosynthesis UDP-glucose lipid carrier transferase
LDEIPQLFNVLQGHMSLVGPRPHPLAMDDAYRRSIAGYMTRNKVRPGITGLAQVRGYRGETDTIEKMEKRVEYDLKYIREWSLLYDVEILIRTAAVLLFQKTAY